MIDDRQTKTEELLSETSRHFNHLTGKVDILILKLDQLVSDFAGAVKRGERRALNEREAEDAHDR